MLGLRNLDLRVKMVDEPDSLVLQLLREMRGDIADIRATMATKTDLAELRSELKSDIADVASDLLTVRKELGEQITSAPSEALEPPTAI